MPLIDQIKQLCDRLGPLGWRDLLLAVTGGALDIRQSSSAKLRSALTTDLPAIPNRLPGFGDFSADGGRGIFEAQPARSLLYHALASPHVLRDGAGVLLRGFPTLAEIELVENFIFAVKPRSLAAVAQEAGRAKLAIVVFAYEYRPGADTAGGTNADLAFSRTGIARVGTARPLYEPETRGFWPEDEDNPHAFRVVPARFSAWLAAAVPGSKARVMPIMWNEREAAKEATRKFWIPVHKLFDGNECLAGVDLAIEFSARFFNLKIRQARRSLGENNPPTEFPFQFEDGIASLVEHSEFGRAAVVPVLHDRLVEPAMLNGKPVTFKVPARGKSQFATYETKSSFRDGVEIHRFPAYVHARTRIENGTHIDLNREAAVNDVVNAGGYEALHYVDFTGEGWVAARVPALAGQQGLTALALPAYTLAAAPDFFPSAGQQELSTWSKSGQIPGPFRDGQMWGSDPVPLAETRLPANLQLPETPFTAEDHTITAVVGMMATTRGAALPALPDVRRSSSLPDDAAGAFAPGWDVAADVKGNVKTGPIHLAAYGLGSPFPEDAKLCAALSTFWPAVAPDVFRTMSLHTGNPTLRGTVAPLTDEEIGQTGDLPWDGVPGPKLVEMNGRRFVEMASFLHVDYVRRAVENRFSLRLTARISGEEYQRRMLAISRVHFVLGEGSPLLAVRPEWLVLSFRAVSSGDAELQQAESGPQGAGAILQGVVYRVEMCFVTRVNVNNGDDPINDIDPTVDSPRGPRFRLLPLKEHNFFFVSAEDRRVLRRRETNVNWAAVAGE